MNSAQTKPVQGPSAQRDDAAHSSGTAGEESEKRSHWAQQRTLLARERTFSAWVRTGISAEVAGLAVARYLAPSGTGDSWIAMALGALLVFVGGLVFVVGFWNYRKAVHRSSLPGAETKPEVSSIVMTVVLLLSAALALALIVHQSIK